MQSFGHFFNFGTLHLFLFGLILECLKVYQQEQFILGFALTLTFLIFPVARGKKISIYDVIISVVAAFCCLYIYVFYDDLVNRGGILLVKEIFGFKVPIEIIIGTIGILILLEATRRAIGLPLVI